jgi:hypothetical protein
MRPLKKRSAASTTALSIAALAVGMGAPPAHAVVPVTPPDYQTDPNGFIKFLLINAVTYGRDLSNFRIEIDGVLHQCAIDRIYIKQTAPVIDPALCVQLDQLLAQQSGDHQGDNNHGDHHQGDNNHGDHHQGDNNHGDLFSPGNQASGDEQN